MTEIAPDRGRTRQYRWDHVGARGSELLLRFKQNGFTVTGSYVFVDSSDPDPSGIGRREVPLKPKHTAGLVGMWEEHGKGRIGLEAC